MAYDSVQELIPGVMNLHMIENPGMAFGWMIPGHPEMAKIILSVFRICAVVAISWYLSKLVKKKAHGGLIVCVALILAGAAGNIFDSAVYGLIFDMGLTLNPNGIDPWQRYQGVASFSSDGYSTFLLGHVVDMFRFTVRWPEAMPWLGGKEIFPPIFNIADAAITFGVGIIIARQRKFFAQPQPPQTDSNLGSTQSP